MKSNRLFHTLSLLIITALLLSGCGRKEAPQMVTDPSMKPQLLNLQHQVVGNVLELTYSLQGNPEGIGLQIDRSEIDPYCQCPGFWQRYQEDTPMAKNVGAEVKKLINLKVVNKEYLFRVRAIDVNGSFSPWSKMIRATGVDLFNK